MSNVGTTALSELAEVNPRLSLQAYGDDMLVSFIPMSDVSEGGKWTVHQERRLGDVRFGYTAFLESDLLFAKITPCMENGKGAHAVGLKNGIGCGSTEFHVLRAKGETSARYLHHWLQARTTRAKAISYMGGSAGQQRVQPQFFDRYRVPKLNPAEQRQAAAVLDQADEAIAKTEAVIAKLRQVRTGLIHDLLTYGLDETGHLRDPIAHPEQFKDSPLGRVPLRWNVKPLGSICRPQQWPTISTPQLTSVGFPVFGANGQIGYYTHFNHEHPTVAITCRGATCGNIHITPPCCYITGNAMALDDLTLSEMRVGFLAEFLRRRGMHDCITGSAQPQIIRSSLLGINIPIPPAPEQDSAIEILKLQDAQIHQHEAELTKLQSIKSGLMDDLLTGRVRVPSSS